jgi:uncharacterized repeat protein (TIGR03803 family)
MSKWVWLGFTAARIRHHLVMTVILSALAGRVFSAHAQTVTILHSFAGSYVSDCCNDGASPTAGLVQGSDGNFYGTTSAGVFDGVVHCESCGTVFRIASDGGSYTNLYLFGSHYYDGYSPLAGLVQGSDGDFYGTTAYGGSNNIGTVFRIASRGSYTNLYSFAGSPTDGRFPQSELVQGSDGNLYGTTYYGGTSNNGTVFRISPSGSETNLYSFGSYPGDGNYPSCGLIQGSDGNFYGTTSHGGTSGEGSVFRISPSGSETILYSFAVPPTDGNHPDAGLVQGTDGDFYGTTFYGGAGANCGSDGCGTVFRISPSGTYTSLYSFGGSPDGAFPEAGLVQGSDGNFYGTTEGGGTNGAGAVFRISPSGSYTNLYSFGSPIGGRPEAGLVQGSDGNFYGTTYYGGTNGVGCVFALTVSLSPPANQIFNMQFFNILGSTIVALPVTSVAGETYQLQYSDSMSPTNWLNTGGSITSIGGPLVLIDIAEPLPPQRFYRAAIIP